MNKDRLSDKQVKIGSQILEIKPIKMKYIKAEFYLHHMSIKKIGLIKLLSSYSDGEEILKNYLKAVFDVEEISEDIIDNLDVETISIIREKVNKINEIEEQDPNI